MTDIHMPRLDPGMQSGKIVEWLKKEGDQVKKGDPVVVVEGEKTTFEIDAPDSGPHQNNRSPWNRCASR